MRAKALKQEVFSRSEVGGSGTGNLEDRGVGEVQEGARVLGNSVA